MPDALTTAISTRQLRPISSVLYKALHSELSVRSSERDVVSATETSVDFHGTLFRSSLTDSYRITASFVKIGSVTDTVYIRA